MFISLYQCFLCLLIILVHHLGAFGNTLVKRSLGGAVSNLQPPGLVHSLYMEMVLQGLRHPLSVMCASLLPLCFLSPLLGIHF